MQRAYSGGTNFYKACTVDGTAIGFAGWVLENPSYYNPKQKKCKEQENFLPQTLDVAAWQVVSKALLKERRRVLDGLDNVLRK